MGDRNKLGHQMTTNSSKSFTCGDCGQSFEVPQAALKKYPGWVPQRCRSCRPAVTTFGGPQQRKRAPKQARRNGPPLTTAEVLQRFDRGPQDGIFTDGSCEGNPGPGGWGVVVVVKGEVVAERFGHDAQTTNNRMELLALINAYDLAETNTKAAVYTDSQLCVRSMTEWAPGWQARGWQRKGGPVKNVDLVRPLYDRYQERPELTLTWIAAHAGNLWNEYADALANRYRL